MNSDIINFVTYCVGNLSRKLKMSPRGNLCPSEEVGNTDGIHHTKL